jgi:hypothetical protein
VQRCYPCGVKQVIRALMCAGVLLAGTAPAAAQQRPLVTEDPETVGAGVMLVEAGIDYGSDVFYPASGLTGNVLRLPALGVSIGLSPFAEIQVDGGVYTRLSINSIEPAPLADELELDGTTTSSLDDLVIGTKIRFVGEGAGRPAFGVRLATKLPTASVESGLGLETTDFFIQALIGKTAQSTRIVGNFGLGLLGNAVGGSQNTVYTYGVSLARAVAQGVELVGELNGRFDTDDLPPVGTEDRSALRGGLRYTRGPGRLDGGVTIGLTDNEPEIGFTVGYTYVFNAFRVP